MSFQTIIGDDHFNHLVKMVSSRFCHFKITIFSLINKNTLKLCKIFSTNFHLLVSVSINDSCLKQLLVQQLPNDDLLIPEFHINLLILSTIFP